MKQHDQQIMMDYITSSDKKFVIERKKNLHDSVISTMIKSNEKLSSSERLDIYRNMYPLRMIEAMSIDYPATEEFLGHQKFGDLIVDYTHCYPSTSYSLDHLGKDFPIYIKSRQDFEKSLFLQELITLEYDVVRSFNAKSGGISAEQLPDQNHLELWIDGKFYLSETTYLFESNFDLIAAYDQLLESQKPQIVKRNQKILTYRVNYDIQQVELELWQWQLLKNLQTGMTLGQCLEKLIESEVLELEEIGPKISKLFEQWVAHDVFKHVAFT